MTDGVLGHLLCYSRTCPSSRGWGRGGRGKPTPPAGALGAFHISLYTCCFTPLRGSASSAGRSEPFWKPSHLSCMEQQLLADSMLEHLFLPGRILYSCQLPPFQCPDLGTLHRLSRGYRLRLVTHPALCRGTALHHCLAFTGPSSAAPSLDVSTWTFPVISLPINLCISYRDFPFSRDADRKSSQMLLFPSPPVPALLPLLPFTCAKWPPARRGPGKSLRVDITWACGKETETENIQGDSQFLLSLCC